MPQVFVIATVSLDVLHIGAPTVAAEPQLVPVSMPPDVHDSAFVHVAALSTAQRQLDFVRAIHDMRRDQSRPCISVGTYARLAYENAETVRRILALVKDQTPNLSPCDVIGGAA